MVQVMQEQEAAAPDRAHGVVHSDLVETLAPEHSIPDRLGGQGGEQGAAAEPNSGSTAQGVGWVGYREPVQQCGSDVWGERMKKTWTGEYFRIFNIKKLMSSKS